MGSEGVDHHHGERVERVGETGFALNQKFHDLIAQAVASNVSRTASLQVASLLVSGMHEEFCLTTIGSLPPINVGVPTCARTVLHGPGCVYGLT
jgi:hypothetical protein